MSESDNGEARLRDENEALRARLAALESEHRNCMRAEEALRRERQFLRLLMENIPDNIYFKDRESRFTRVNPALARFYGVDGPSKVVGKRDADFYPAEMADEFLADEQHLINSGEPMIAKVEQAGPDGTEPRWFSTTKAPIRNTSGQVVGIVGISRDITAYKRAEDALRKARDELEARVEKRTRDLLAANRRLVEEVRERRRAEEAMKESEHRYRAIVEDQTELICRWLPGGVHTFVNNAYCRCFGKDSEELLGSSLMALIPEEEHGKVQEHFDSLSRENPIASHEHRVIAKNGQIRWHQWTDRAVFDDNGQIAEYQSVGRDITESKRAEEALRKSEARLSFLLTTSPAVIYTCEPAGAYPATFISENVEALLGYGVQEFTDGPSFWADHIHPEDAPRVFSELPRLFEHGHHLHEYRFRHQDGTCVWMRDEMRLVRAADGSPREIVGYWIDITEQKRAEEALSESEVLFRTVVDASKDAMIAIDKDGLVRLFNPAAETMFGQAKERMIGQPLDCLMPEGYQQRHARYVKGFFTRGGLRGAIGKTLELPALRADGKVFPVELSLSAGLHSDTEPFVLAVIRGITERKQAEETLRRSEDKFRSLVETTSDWVWEMDQDSRYTYASPKVKDLLGYEPEEVIGKTPFDFMPVEEAKRVASVFRVRAESQEPFAGLENVNIHRNGRRVVLETSGVPILDGNGRVLGYRGIDRDITTRKKAEEELRKFKTISDRTPHGNAISDLDGRLLYVNEAFARMHGYAREELIGAHISVLHTEEQMSHVDRMNAKLRHEGSYVSEEVWHKRRDGNVFPTLMDAAFITDSNGAPLFFSVMMVDISDRKRAEATLRRQALVFNSINDGVIITDRQDRIADWNTGAEQIFGYCKEEVIGKSPELLNRPEEAKLITDSIHTGIQQDGYWSSEVNFVHKDGREGVCEAFLVQLNAEDGGWIGTVSVNRDITSRRQAEKEKAKLEGQLRQAQKMEAVGLLAGGIAHDFSNLLTAIFGYTDLAKTTLPDGHPAARALEMVEQSARQARGVTNALLTFSRKKVAEKAPVDFVKTVRDTLRLLRHVLPASIDVVEVLPDTSEIWVNADATQLQQVVMNLAVNARDAMPDGGVLRISLRKEPARDMRTGRQAASGTRLCGTGTGPSGEVGQPGEAVLVVEDTGVGMTDEVSSRVFEPFFTTKPRGQGTGLGMSVIHGIVTDQDGHIEVSSRSGRGTRVTAAFPCCVPAAEQPKPSEPRFRNGNGEVVVVVEDDEHVRSIITSTLRSRGYEVLPAADGVEALATLDAHRGVVRLIVLDLDLPQKDGASFLGEAQQRHGKIPFIVVTGSAGVYDPAGEMPVPRIGKERGAVDDPASTADSLPSCGCLLRKPFQMLDLMALVSQLLEPAAVGRTSNNGA
ncbi:MAG: PAS domain S-box protein [Phycisphaerae bacterium]|nr:PAS domain S-box protein [Phycisphaerae bacterium]